MTEGLDAILFVPDPHHPYSHKKAWQLLLQVGEALKPKHLVVQGDIADFFSISNYSKDPSRAENLDWEIEQVNKALDELDALGAENKLFMEGNHEYRLARYLQDKAPELFSYINVPKLFRLKERGWKHTPYKQHTKLGKLYLTHDVGSAGRYNVFRTLDAFQHNISTAHTHRLAYVVEGNATGDAMVSAQFGWLGDVEQVDYMHRVMARRNWALGFGVGYLERRTGNVFLSPVPIVRNGKRFACVVNGVLHTV